MTDERRTDESPPRRGLTRRGLITTAGVAGAGLGLGAAGYALGQERAGEDGGDGTGTVPFWGDRQAGIVTAQQDRLHLAAFDVTAETPAELEAQRRSPPGSPPGRATTSRCCRPTTPARPPGICRAG